MAPPLRAQIKARAVVGSRGSAGRGGRGGYGVEVVLI
jgi:hypothetical protein